MEKIKYNEIKETTKIQKKKLLEKQENLEGIK